MKWIKHDTDANQDAKLQNVLLDYGLEGYGLYWYCIELIAGKVDKSNITFELEHDARIIARNVGSTAQKVEEMMRYFVKLGLFENCQGTITCLKLAKRLDKSMTSNPEMRSIIESLKNHDGVMTESENIMQDKIRLDQNRKDNTSCDEQSSPRVKKSKFDERDHDFAVNMFERILVVNPSAKKPNYETWANDIRIARERDNRTIEQLWRVFAFANSHSFWATNILSPKKLREHFDRLTLEIAKHERHKSNGPGNASAADQVRAAFANSGHTYSND